LLEGRRFEFDVERAIFLTVLHRLFSGGSDRSCAKWRRDYKIDGIEDLDLHHLYRAMAFLGEESTDQKDATPFSPRCTKDTIEEELFFRDQDLFSSLDLVFFDTTSLYFEGAGGDTLGQRGYSKDHRPDLNQMVVGAVLNSKGRPICCEMWPGNTADVKTIIPVAHRFKNRFHIQDFCLVADRGMISEDNLIQLEDPTNNIKYILGVRMRRVKAIKQHVLNRAGRYQEIYPEGSKSKDPAPLKVKEVWHDGKRYIVCVNTRQVRKDAADRQAILAALQERIKTGPKQMIGNKGYRKYLKVDRGCVQIDYAKVKADECFDGKWVLTTNTDLPTKEVALKYKELWMVEQVFRNAKSLLDTRPIFHQKDETIRGHVFCSFLAMVLKKELEQRLGQGGHSFEWADVQQDLKALQEVRLEEKSKRLHIRSECVGVCGKVFQSVGVAIPSVIREQ